MTCVCCGGQVELQARGLCPSCYSRHHKAGTLSRYPRAFRTLAEAVEDWGILRARGMTKRQASVHMGYKPKTLENLLLRATKPKAE